MNVTEETFDALLLVASVLAGLVFGAVYFGIV